MKMRHTETNSFIHAVDSLLHKSFQQWCLYRKEVQGTKRMGTIWWILVYSENGLVREGCSREMTLNVRLKQWMEINQGMC